MAEVAIEKRFEIEWRPSISADGWRAAVRLLYRPISQKFRWLVPALIDVHGGAWASGDRLNNAPLDEAREERHRRAGDRFPHAAPAPLPSLDRRRESGDTLAEAPCR
jgi:hypothetical protein